MKALMLLLVVMIASWAAAWQSAAATLSATQAPRASCAGVRALAAEFNRLNYFERADHARGDGALWRKFAQCMEEYRKIKAQSEQQLTDLVLLMAAAIPYQVESDWAEVLAGLVGKSPAMRAAYERALSEVRESCRRENLKVSVDAYICYRVHPNDLKCASKFDFDACLRRSKSLRTKAAE